MLEKALGPGKAIVRLSCALNFKRQEKTEERFYPENQVVRSEQQFNEKASEPQLTPEGIPGIRANLPGTDEANQTGETATTTTFEKQDRTVNYEIGKVTSHTVEPIGDIERISVAVLVDGTYKQVRGTGGEIQQTYVPRTAEEMQKLEKICMRAVNFDDTRGDKVEVVNIPFETTQLRDIPESAEVPVWMAWLKSYQSYLKYGFFGLFLLLSFVFIIKPLVRWLTDQSLAEMEMVKQLPKTVAELESDYGASSPQLTFTDRASQLVASDNEASVGVMRDWLKEK
jgi:flagellar M-ring protein FliF